MCVCVCFCVLFVLLLHCVLSGEHLQASPPMARVCQALPWLAGAGEASPYPTAACTCQALTQLAGAGGLASPDPAAAREQSAFAKPLSGWQVLAKRVLTRGGPQSSGIRGSLMVPFGAGVAVRSWTNNLICILMRRHPRKAVPTHPNQEQGGCPFLI